MATDGKKLNQLPELTTLSDATMLYAVDGGEDYHVNFETIKDETVPEVFTPTTDGLVPHPNSGNGGKVLRGDGTWQGTFDSSNDGLVPKLGTNDKDNVLRGDGTWVANDKLIGTGSGSLVTFDAIEAPMPSLKVSVEAKQEGSGTPSPENVRPISGWSEVVVSDVGKNLAKSIIHGYISNTYNKVVIDNDSESVIFYAKKGITYTISSTATLNKSRLGLVATDNVINDTPCIELIELADDVRTWTSTWDGWTVWYVSNERKTEFDTSAQVEVGTSATAFEPYNPDSYTTTIPLGQTVYGGEVDVVNGTSGNKITYGFIQGFTRGALDSSGKLYKLSPILDDVAMWTDTSKASEKIMSNMFEVLSLRDARAATTPSISQYDTGLYVGGYVGDEATLDALLSNLQVKYELATPTTLTTQPTLIKSLNGQNNLSVDCGDVLEVEYQRSITEAINALEAGGGYSETSLWSNSSGVYTGSLALSDSIENYNALMFKVSNAQGWANFAFVPTSALASNNAKAGIGGGMQSAVWWFQFTRTDATHITINNNSSTGDKLYQIVGVKY